MIENDEPLKRQLPVTLGAAELEARAHELAEHEQKLYECEVALDQAQSEWSATKKRREQEITDARQKVHDLAVVVRTRQEERSVECSEVLDVDASAVNLVRNDTGEVVSVRAMTEQDRQRSLFQKSNLKKASAKA